MEFSFYTRPISNIRPQRSVTLSETFEWITSDKYEFVTRRIRVASTKEIRQNLKTSTLDYVTFSGEFEKRSNNELKKHSGLIVLDFDDLDIVEEVRETLLNDSSIETALLFRSPSGNGLKWVVPINLDEATHQEWFEGISNYLKVTHGLEVDQSGKDVARPCFLCHDPNAYLNPNFTNDPAENAVENETTFNPHEWMGKMQLAIEVEKQEEKVAAKAKPDPQLLADIEKVIAKIEQNKLDLTKVYKDWRNIGFALTDSLGEDGRESFHRISRFYPGYDPEECDRQYNNCLNSNGTGITKSTLFHLAQQAEPELPPQNEQDESESLSLPNFGEDIYSKLPDFFQQIVMVGSNNIERDVLLTGSLVTISAVLPNVKGIYDGKYVYPNLYLFVIGMPGSGKSKLDPCRKLVKPIQENYTELYKQEKLKYQANMAIYRDQKKDNPTLIRPLEPKQLLIILPANISSAGLYELLNNNGGTGLIFETEGDTLADAFRNKDFGNFSDAFRKAFHHETISSYRKSLQELFKIEEPKLSVVLSGTPQQVLNLIPNAENGLFSRFVYYFLPLNIIWNNVFKGIKGTTLDEYFLDLGSHISDFFDTLKLSPQILFRLTEKQQSELNLRFERLQKQNSALLGDHFVSVIRRMGLIVYRIAMIFTAIRNMDSIPTSDSIECSDDDFNNAMVIGAVLLEHSKEAFRGLKETPVVKHRENLKEKFLNALPEEFDRSIYQDVAKMVGLNQRTAEGYISKFCQNDLVHRIMHNHYKKIA